MWQSWRNEKDRKKERKGKEKEKQGSACAQVVRIRVRSFWRPSLRNRFVTTEQNSLLSSFSSPPFGYFSSRRAPSRNNNDPARERDWPSARTPKFSTEGEESKIPRFEKRETTLRYFCTLETATTLCTLGFSSSRSSDHKLEKKKEKNEFNI